MTLKEKVARYRQRGRGRKTFWIALALGLAVIVIGARRGSDRYDRGSGYREAGHQGLAVRDIEQLVADNGKWLERAGLSDEQIEEITEVLERAAPELQALQAERVRLGRELASALASSADDLDHIDELRRQANELSARAIDQSFYVAVDLAEVLTPEQRGELAGHWRKKS